MDLTLGDKYPEPTVLGFRSYSRSIVSVLKEFILRILDDYNGTNFLFFPYPVNKRVNVVLVFFTHAGTQPTNLA